MIENSRNYWLTIRNTFNKIEITKLSPPTLESNLEKRNQ